jgi:hypothetical protein
MSNHVHLMVETPRGNLSAFMGSLLTSYMECVGGEQVLGDVCRYYGIDRPQLAAHRKRDRIKPVAATLLRRWSGLTQRAIAELLGVKTGVAAV